MRKGRKCHKCGYEKNAPEAAWCGLCYEPFNKAGAGQPAEQAPAPPPLRPEAGRAAKPLLLICVALLGMAAAIWEFEARRGSARAGEARGENRFAEKTAAAERLLETHRTEQAAFLAEIETDGADPDGFGIEGAYTKKLFRMEDAYANAVNALGLPCPSCVDTARDAAYLAWTAEHQRRETELMNEFNAAYGRLAAKAVSPRP